VSEGVSASAPVLDRAHLAQYSGGDAALEAELFDLLEAQMTACIETMGRAGPGDDRTWRDAAHTLKGAARGVGAMQLGEACAAAEARPLDRDALEALIKAAQAARDAMRAAHAG
jgi:HPt (histidine-containing phosphotransfer) domain-containing protein